MDEPFRISSRTIGFSASLAARVSDRPAFSLSRRKWLKLLEDQLGEPPSPSFRVHNTAIPDPELSVWPCNGFVSDYSKRIPRTRLVFSCHEFRRRSITTWLRDGHSSGPRMPGSRTGMFRVPLISLRQLPSQIRGSDFLISTNIGSTETEIHI